MYLIFSIYKLNENVVEMSRPKLDSRAVFNSGLLRLNLGHRFKLDPTSGFPQCISENKKNIFETITKGERKRKQYHITS